MFGSAILDVIIGLVFVYLILSLICSAINEYIASLLNKRGKMLVRGIQSMLRDVNLEHTIFKHPLMASYFPHHETLAGHAEENKRWMPGFRWVRRLLTWVFNPRIREARYPSYVSARVFATAFLEQAKYVDELLRREEARRQAAGTNAPSGPAPSGGSPGKDAESATPPTTPVTKPVQGTSTASTDATPSGVRPTDPAALPSGTTTTPAPATSAGSDATPSGVRPTDPATPPAPSTTTQTHTPPSGGFFARLAWWRRRAEKEAQAEAQRLGNAQATLDRLMLTFRRDATLAPFSALSAVASVASVLPDAEKAKLVDQALLWRNEAESVLSGVETWFNNSMDRVSGAYKRHTQIVLLFIGLVVAVFVNADTIELWKRLSADPKLREGLAAQAAASLPQVARLAALDSAARARHDQVVDSGAVRGTVDSSQVTQEQARAMFDSASALLERTNLDFGWSWEDAQVLGFAVQLDSLTAEKAWNFRVRKAVLSAMKPRDEKYVRQFAAIAATTDTARHTRLARLRNDHHWEYNTVVKMARQKTQRPEYAYVPGSWRHPHWTFFWAKLLGLLLTTFALSLGAPFWFDTLNKIINIRAAGRAPATTPAPTPADGTKPGDAKP